MSTRVCYYIICDECGETAGHSHTEEVARQEVQRHGWVRMRDGCIFVDLCWRCVERGATQQRQSEVQS